MSPEEQTKIPVVRLRLDCETTADFYANYAKQLAGDFFVAQELDLDDAGRTLVRVSLPTLGLKLYGEGRARPAEKTGRKGVVIRLHKLESDGVKLPLLEMGGAADDDPFSDAPTRASQLPQEMAEELRKRLNMRVSRSVVPRDKIAQTNSENGEVKNAAELAELHLDSSEFQISELVRGAQTGPIDLQNIDAVPSDPTGAPTASQGGAGQRTTWVFLVILMLGATLAAVYVFRAELGFPW